MRRNALPRVSAQRATRLSSLAQPKSTRLIMQHQRQLARLVSHRIGPRLPRSSTVYNPPTMTMHDSRYPWPSLRRTTTRERRRAAVKRLVEQAGGAPRRATCW